MNDRGFVEPYQNLTKIPNENRKDHTEAVGNASQVWIDNPFNNSMEMESYLKLNSSKVVRSFENTSKKDLTWEEYFSKWNKIFEINEISTPIGKVKIGDNQIFKNFYKDDSRALLIGMIKQSLENPLMIIKSKKDHGNTERPYIFQFVSSFQDKERIIHYVQTTVSKEGKEILISSHERPVKQIFKIAKSGKILFTRKPWQSEPSGSHVLNLALKEGSSENYNATNLNPVKDKTMDNNKDVSKGFFGFGSNEKSKPSVSGGSPPRQGLVKKQIIDSRGRNQTKWVRPNEVQTPIERKRDEAKNQRKKVSHLNHSEEDKKKIEEITKRHKEFENKAKEQRRVFGSGPQLPKPGIIMRVYAQGKVNVGGMLAEVQRIAEDGKSVFAMLTSGKTYEFPLEQLHFAKSLLYETLEKDKESRNN